MLAAVPLWALYSVLLKRRPMALPDTVFLTCITGLGVALLLPAYLWERAARGGIALSADNLMAIAFLGEAPHLYHLGGIALIVAGLVLASARPGPVRT